MSTRRPSEHPRNIWRRWILIWVYFQSPDADPTVEEVALFVATYLQLRRLGLHFAEHVDRFVRNLQNPKHADATEDFLEDATDSDCDWSTPCFERP